MKACRECKQSLPLVMFCKDRSRLDGHKGRCRACESEVRRRAGTKRLRLKSDEYIAKMDRVNRRTAANLIRDGGSKTLRSVMMELLGVRDV